MEDVYPIPEILSHPDVPLSRHLFETSQNIKIILEHVCLQLFEEIAEPHILRSVALLNGALHDIGKATSFFQEYIRNPKGRKRDPKKQHASLGSVYIYWGLMHDSLDNFWNGTKKDIRNVLALLASIAIAKHHGNLENLRDEKNHLRSRIKEFKDETSILWLQVSDTLGIKERMDKIIEFAIKDTGVSFPSWTCFIDEITYQETLDALVKKSRKLNKAFQGIEMLCDNNETQKTKDFKVLPYRITMLLHFWYSLLQEADKTHAMRAETVNRITWDLLEKVQQKHGVWFKSKQSIELDNFRSKIFKESIDYASTMDCLSVFIHWKHQLVVPKH